MPYLNETGLAHYDPKLKEWIASQPVKTIPSSLYPWTLTAKAGAVTCWPVGGTELLPTVDFMFSETPPASGDKGPENPSTITGVSNIWITRCGKNILPLSPIGTTTINQVSFTVNTDGSITVNGKASADTDFVLATKFSISKKSTFFSGCPSSGSSSTYSLHVWVFNNNTLTLVSDDFGAGFFYSNTNGGIRQATVAIRIKKDYIANNLTFYPQAEFSTTATAFEPYDGADYTIPLNGTYYGGSVDLATGVLKVTWVGETITTVSTYDAMYTNTIRFVTNTVANHKSASYTETSLACNKFIVANNQNDEEHCRLAGSSDGTQFYLFIAKSRLDVSGAADPSNPAKAEWNEAARAWLAENPVFVAFELATPFTVPLTPVLVRSLPALSHYAPRQNTIYTPHESVQVGYAKSPIREEYELTQAIVSQGGNI